MGWGESEEEEDKGETVKGGSDDLDVRREYEGEDKKMGKRSRNVRWRITG